MIDLSLIQRTPHDAALDIASRMRARRKTLHMTQAELASKSAVSLGSLRRFEQTGSISLDSLLRIAVVLDCLSDFDALFARRGYTSIQEVIDEQRR